jgi:uncharacterized protein YndB with AHSA1/START domain
MSTTIYKPTETFADRALTITRVFAAPRHLVFEAWTKKEHLDQWSAPQGFTIPFSKGDVRPGGAWRCSMRPPNGIEYGLGGTYREVVEDTLLVFTHAWDDEEGRPGHETVLTVEFVDHGEKTKIILEQANFATNRSRDSHHGGWTECLECLAEYLAKIRAQSGT